MSVADVVVVSLKQDQLVGRLFDVVEVEVVTHHAVLDGRLCRSIGNIGSLGQDHPTLRVEGIVARGKACPRQHLVQIQGSVLGHLVSVADVVVVALIADELVRELLHIVDVEVPPHDTVLYGGLYGKSGNRLFSNNHSAYAANLLLLTGHAGGGFDGRDPIAGRVSLGGDRGLGNQDFTASRAMLALGEACLGAGGCHGGINDLGVTQSGNGNLRYEDFTASRAMLAFGEACFGAGRRHGGVNDLGVTRFRQNHSPLGIKGITT